MKKIITLFAAISLFAIESVIAQAPEAFKYQAIARNSSGGILASQNVSFRISILQGSTSGTSVYSETQAATTNQFGLANLNIGQGTVVSGTFNTINWGTNTYFVKVEFDPTGGSSYVLMGTSQLLSVPYALYSASTGDTSMWKKNGTSIYYNTGVEIGTKTPTSPVSLLTVAGVTSIIAGNPLQLFTADNSAWASFQMQPNGHFLNENYTINVTNGDVYVSNNTKGIILVSPSGQCYRVTVGNTGTLTSAAIACPN